jgi:preprotein translocase subunit SecG
VKARDGAAAVFLLCENHETKRPWLTVYPYNRYNLAAKIPGGLLMIKYLDGALILTSIALVVSIILQSKGAGLGSLTGDSGGVFTARRGIEKTLFWVTIVFSAIFFLLAITLVIITARA